MIYLLLTTLCASALNIVIRWSKGKVRSSMAMIATNYLTCTILCACIIGPGNIVPRDGGFAPTLGLGLLNGVFYMSAMVATQYAIQRNGVVLPSLFSKLGALLVPMVVSIFLFKEAPTAFQGVGFALALAAIVLMNYSTDSIGALGVLLLILLTEGCASSMAKVYRELGTTAYSNHYLLLTFGCAFTLCAILVLAKKEKFGWRELVFGMMIGIPNFIGARFVLRALAALPAVIVYPIRSVGSIAIITIAGVCLFKEKLTRRQIIALATAAVAVVLLNL